MKKRLKNILRPTVRKIYEFIGIISIELLTKIRYFQIFRKVLNLKDPKNLNEKIQWLKLYTDTTEWSRLADKYAVRDYIKECGLEDNLVKLYGKWDNANDIDFNSLPNSFVLKTNHGSGGIIVVKDKSLLDELSTRKELNSYISKPYGGYTAEFHYKKIKPCIIAEELLPTSSKYSSNIIDYKVWCFNGKPHSIAVYTNRDHHSHESNIVVYDLNWEVQNNAIHITPIRQTGNIIPRPKELSEMIKMAEVLSKPFAQVRVDFYIVNNKIYFGEMTFTSTAGMMTYYTDEFLLSMGNLIDIHYKPE